jgi:hypothetical protein
VTSKEKSYQAPKSVPASETGRVGQVEAAHHLALQAAVVGSALIT